MKRPISVAEIARQLNISKATASAALSGRGGNTRVSEETASRVRELAQRFNYRANASAAAMRRRRFNTLGFFVAKKKTDDYAASDIISPAIVEAAEKHGQTVLLVCVPAAPTGVPVIPRPLGENCLDALIVQNAMLISPAYHAAIASSQVPVVYMNEKAPANAVYTDDVESGRMMTEYLIGQGFRKIAILAPAGLLPHYSSADRVAGYLEAMTRAGLAPTVKTPPTSVWRGEVAEWLRSGERPEAIFCVADRIAVQLQAVLYELRLRVPEDIAIAGCDDEIFAAHSIVPLTTLKIPFAEMARISVEQAVNRVDSPGELPSVVLHAELVVRSSTRR